jgi:trans-AT polyketide synthase/acyltransferase/oxidoreductase domain-containing protein
MGGELFDEFAEYTAIADRVLGYSIKTLCLADPEKQLKNTAFAQPALYVVSVLSYLKRQQADTRLPDYLAGHSLGEYPALFAAGAFDFATGLRLVQRRGELMSRENGGAMAAVLSMDLARIREILREAQLDAINVANMNSPSQIVLSGPGDAIAQAQKYFRDLGAVFLPLNVSAAFHSRYMRPAAEEFARIISDVPFRPLRIPVVSNVLARPYQDEEIRENLVLQIYHPVRWTETIQFLLREGVTEVEEVGPGGVLTKLTAEIRNAVFTSGGHGGPGTAEKAGARPDAKPRTRDAARKISAERLGADTFRRAYGVRYAYVAGAMYKAIASKELVVRMGKAKMLAFYGTGGVSPARVEQDLRYIRDHLGDGEPFGMNLLSSPMDPAAEMAMVDLFLKYGVNNVEAAAYVQVSPALAAYRLRGLSMGSSGEVVIGHRVLAKVSRPEVADVFLHPAPKRIVEQLWQQALISDHQAELAAKVAMADDICVEADSGGHTDAGNMMVLLPSMIRQRDRVCSEQGYHHPVRAGAAGGLGTPEAIATAFMLGAEFVLTGSINQCSVEADTSDEVKDMLASLNVQDTAYAPAGDMFELGAKIQVMKKGVFFPARANKLYELWRNHGAWQEIDPKIRAQIESKYFKRSFEAVSEEVRKYFMKRAPGEIEKAEANPRHKMALVFRWYFVYTSRLARKGDSSDRVNYQVHTGPALGAFNQWVKGSEMEHWRSRHVDDMGRKLMEAAAHLLEKRLVSLLGSGEEEKR